MTRIPLVPVYPSFLFIFQEEKIIAEIKKWNSKYCILISDSCFQCLYADRKFWSRRYLFPHLCIRISDNTGYPDREFFFLIQEERDSFKELIAKKDQLNRMQRSVAKTFQEVLELTGSLCFMFRSTPTWKTYKMTILMPGYWICISICRIVFVQIVFVFVWIFARPLSRGSLIRRTRWQFSGLATKELVATMAPWLGQTRT